MNETQKRSYLWLFTLGAAFVPFIVPEHLLVVPLCALGFLWPPAWGLATRLNRLMFRVVLGLQPWYQADIDFPLPPEVAARTRGCLVVANHRSHLDAFLLFHELTHLRLVAKHSLYYVPFYGHLMPLLRMIRVRQRDPDSFVRAMAQVRQGLEAHHRVALFPEMTRCEEGALRTGRFARAPFHAARETGAAVLPVAIWGSDAIWAKGSQKIARRKKVWMRALPAVDPAAFPDSILLANHVQREIDKAVLELRAQAEAEAKR